MWQSSTAGSLVALARPPCERLFRPTCLSTNQITADYYQLCSILEVHIYVYLIRIYIYIYVDERYIYAYFCRVFVVCMNCHQLDLHGENGDWFSIGASAMVIRWELVPILGTLSAESMQT